jgi:hypothetical protein
MDKNAKTQTDPLPLLAHTPTLPWDITTLKQHIWFERTSGPGPDNFEDEEEKDTDKSSIPIMQDAPTECECKSCFTSLCQSSLSLFRSAVQYHSDKYGGVLPEFLIASPERCKSFEEEMKYIYGEDFQGRLIIPCSQGSKFVHIAPNDALDKYTIICIHLTCN